jgi:hypothetical protein
MDPSRGARLVVEHIHTTVGLASEALPLTKADRHGESGAGRENRHVQKICLCPTNPVGGEHLRRKILLQGQAGMVG